MEKEYQKHIVSTEDNQVWLHRTHKSNIESILQNGLSYGSGDLSSTATLQSRNLEDAEKSYSLTHRGSNAMAVIKIPSSIYKKYYFPSSGGRGIRHEGYDTDPEVTYFESGCFTIQRQHIHGWIDTQTGKYFANPYKGEKQIFKERSFPTELYGDLLKK